MTIAVLPPVHPAARLFPEMSAEEYAALRASIREHGQQEPIVMHEEMILDGRHRWRACQDEGIEPQTTYWLGECGSPTSFVIAKNLHRRHMTSSQRAAVATEALPLFEAEAKERQRAALARGNVTMGRGTDVASDETVRQIVEQPSGKAVERAAKEAGTNRQYVADAKKLKEEAPDLFEQVRDGVKTIPQAKKEAIETQQIVQAQANEETIARRDSRYAAARLRRTYDDVAISMHDKLFPLDQEALIAAFDQADRDGALDLMVAARRWFDGLERALKSGLRVIGRTGS